MQIIIIIIIIILVLSKEELSKINDFFDDKNDKENQK